MDRGITLPRPAADRQCGFRTDLPFGIARGFAIMEAVASPPIREPPGATGRPNFRQLPHGHDEARLPTNYVTGRTDHNRSCSNAITCTRGCNAAKKPRGVYGL